MAAPSTRACRRIVEPIPTTPAKTTTTYATTSHPEPKREMLEAGQDKAQDDRKPEQDADPARVAKRRAEGGSNDSNVAGARDRDQQKIEQDQETKRKRPEYDMRRDHQRMRSHPVIHFSSNLSQPGIRISS